jgi:hypothetical protein
VITVTLEIGDKVKTDYYPKDRELVRLVINVKPYIGASQSGYEVTTKDIHGRILSCDMDWYNRQEAAGE